VVEAGQPRRGGRGEVGQAGLRRLLIATWSLAHPHLPGPGMPSPGPHPVIAPRAILARPERRPGTRIVPGPAGRGQARLVLSAYGAGPAPFPARLRAADGTRDSERWRLHAPAPRPDDRRLGVRRGRRPAVGPQDVLRARLLRAQRIPVSVVTTVAANRDHGVLPMPADVVREQIVAVAEGLRLDGTKFGALGSAAVVEAVADAMRTHRDRLVRIVLDPVMVSAHGT